MMTADGLDAAVDSTDIAGRGDEIFDGDDDQVEDVEFDLDASTEVTEVAANTRLRISGGDGLSLSEADEAVAANPSKVVLIAGEANAGKTTLLVELFAQFLAGPVGDWCYAGSRTLRGFDRRHRPARASSGALVATTARTQDDDLRHLHLAIASAERRVDLILSDIRGEVFEGIIDGRSAREELPFLPRVDHCLVLLDGEQMATRSVRDLQILRGQQLLDGLLEPDGLRDGSSVMIVVTKVDTLNADARLEVEDAVGVLTELAGSRPIDFSAHVISARPEAGSAPVGLDEILDQLTRDEPGVKGQERPSAPTQGRYFWRGSS